MAEQEVLLKVEHLCQYFGTNKAVDDVSFDIKKGEVFGLVGESGCGKTTTGRSIIKLYDITSGNIYFKGKRIAAGVKSYKDAIAAAKAEMKKADPARKEELKRIIAQNREEIRKARFDHEKCDKIYANAMADEVDAKYAEILKTTPADKLDEVKREYAYEKNIAKRQRFTTQIQMIFQDPIASLDPRMTVYEIIAEGLSIRGETNKAVVDEKVYKVLEMVGLVREHAGRYPHEFSGGQRQRIGVARAVIMNPELIIADEPVSALDVSIQAQVINMFDDLQDRLGLTYLFIAHDLLVVRHISDRIAVMYLGKMVELASAEEIYNHPLHPYSKSLLSAVPLPDPKAARANKRIVLSGDIPSPLNAPSGCPFRTRCPYATEACAQSMPPFNEVEKGHFVACHRVKELG